MKKLSQVGPNVMAPLRYSGIDSLRRLMVRLAEHVCQVPSTLFLPNLQIRDVKYRDGGFYGNIFTGTISSGEQVGLKVLKAQGNKDDINGSRKHVQVCS